MGFSLRKLGRAIDPTSKSAPLGGLVRQGISAIPGGATALNMVDQAKALGIGVNLGGGKQGRPQAPPGAPPPPPPTDNIPVPKPGIVGWFKSLGAVGKGIAVGGTALVAFLIFRMFRKRK